MEQQNFTPQPPQNPVAPPVPPMPPTARRLVAKMKDKWFALITILFSVLWIDFSVFSRMNLGFTIATAGFFVISLIYLWGKDMKLSPYALFCGIAAVGASVPFALHANGFDRFGSFCVILALMALYCVLLSDCNRFDAGTFRTVGDVILNYVFIPFRYVGTAIGSLFFRADAAKDPKKSRIWLGILLSVPVVLVVVPLLIATNPFFKEIFETLFRNIGELLARVILGLLVFPFLFAALFAYARRLPRTYRTAPKEHKGKIDPLIIQSFFSVLSVVYVIYLVSQIAYFFSAFNGLLPKGYEFTVAEYARKGFFEMCVVAGINLVVVFFGLLSVKKKEGGATPSVTKGLTCFVGCFTLLLIGTALSKMVLYIRNFGMTRLRIGTSCFMILLAFVFLFALIRIFAEKFPYMKAVVCTAAIIVVAVGVMDIDTTIARYNVRAYQNGTLKEMDVNTVRDLSDGAVPYLIELLDDKDPNVSEVARDALVDRVFAYYDIKCDVHSDGDDDTDIWCERQNPYYYYSNSDYAKEDELHDQEIHSAGSKPTIVLRGDEYPSDDFRYYNRDEQTAIRLLGENAERILIHK